MPRGAVTDNYYVPTTEEKRVISEANTAFLSSYFTGIIVGATGGTMLVRRRNIPIRSLPAVALLAATTLTGELIGRKTGEARAKDLLAAGLPSGSHLRTMLEENTKGITIPRVTRPENTQGVNDVGLEGGMVDDDAQQDQPHGQQAQQPSGRWTPPKTQEKESRVWDAIRGANPASQTTWGRIRNGTAPAPPPPAQTDPDATPPLIPRTKADLLAHERAGHVRRTPYGDLDTPTTHSAGGQGLMGPHGDTVAATSAGSRDEGGLVIPRTREEMEREFASGRVRRNAYGDLVD
ncbi:hypothetical protein HKX48_007691 [Thoreauomyces humboldtii]|nr:hypothetical protein HKX48_007691 [Thoreauomyces humboldtii]